MTMRMEIGLGGSVGIYGVKILQAAAKECGGAEWLDIIATNGGGMIHEITIFMPLTTAQEYANAINACNDREAVDARENANANA